MLFWIFVMLLIGSIVWLILSNEWSDVRLLATIVTVVMSFVVAIAAICIVVDHVSADAYIASNAQRYESLIYQYQNDLYDNDNDLGKKELMNQIQDWNEDLASKRALQDNFWVGIFYPSIYDRFEFIDLEHPGLVPIKDK